MTTKANVIKDSGPGYGTRQYYTHGTGWTADPTAATAYADRYDASGDALRLLATEGYSNQRIYVRESISTDGGTTWNATGDFNPGITPGYSPARGETQ